MSAGRDSRPNTDPPNKRMGDDANMLALLGKLNENRLADLEDIEEPTAAELAALEELDIEDLPPLPTLSILPPMLSNARQIRQPFPSAPAEPELVSFEGLADEALDDIEDSDALEEDLPEESLDELLENYADQDLDDDEIDDGGYDLDDDDIDHYQDLYGEDGDITPSFIDGEIDDDDDGGVAYYDDLR